jgi:hypothetical protein
MAGGKKVPAAAAPVRVMNFAPFHAVPPKIAMNSRRFMPAPGKPVSYQVKTPFRKVW